MAEPSEEIKQDYILAFWITDVMNSMNIQNFNFHNSFNDAKNNFQNVCNQKLSSFLENFKKYPKIELYKIKLLNNLEQKLTELKNHYNTMDYNACNKAFLSMLKTLSKQAIVTNLLNPNHLTMNSIVSIYIKEVESSIELLKMQYITCLNSFESRDYFEKKMNEILMQIYHAHEKLINEHCTFCNTFTYKFHELSDKINVKISEITNKENKKNMKHLENSKFSEDDEKFIDELIKTISIPDKYVSTYSFDELTGELHMNDKYAPTVYIKDEIKRRNDELKSSFKRDIKLAYVRKGREILKEYSGLLSEKLGFHPKIKKITSSLKSSDDKRLYYNPDKSHYYLKKDLSRLSDLSEQFDCELYYIGYVFEETESGFINKNNREIWSRIQMTYGMYTPERLGILTYNSKIKEEFFIKNPYDDASKTYIFDPVDMSLKIFTKFIHYLVGINNKFYIENKFDVTPKEVLDNLPDSMYKIKGEDDIMDDEDEDMEEYSPN